MTPSTTVAARASKTFASAEPPAHAVDANQQHLPWVEYVKAAALLWIAWNHICERIFGSPLFGNPDAQWPSLAARIQQFFSAPLIGHTPRLWLALRDFGWMGDQGVSLFLMVSGLTLVWSTSQKCDGQLVFSEFYRRRVLRIYPTWIVAHLLFILPLAIFGVHFSLLDGRLFWSMMGIRVLPSQLYFGNPSWWFVTLLLQLYAVYPFLWRLFQRFQPARAAAVLLTGSLLIRALGLFELHSYLDAWARGALFVSRLPEFVLGMLGGVVLWTNRGRRLSPATRALCACAGVCVLIAGLAASFSLAGMIVAPLLEGAGALVFLYALACNAKGAVSRKSGFAFASLWQAPLNWVGKHSLSLFLVHWWVVRAFIPAGASSVGLGRLLLGIVLVVAGSVAGAMVLEQITAWVLKAWSSLVAQWGTRLLLVRALAGFCAVWLVLVCGELLVRALAPQEAADLGWGERAALQPDDRFGWKLKPSLRTRLRWVTYDYTTESNSLGFPGPEPPATLSAGTRRILVTGDAFTSAEGVDTNEAWPRLLENKLNADDQSRRTAVLNFSITGYGPNQYRQIAETFVPRYRPDLVIVGLFINDYADVLLSNTEFQKAIGFGNADPNGLAAVLCFRQLSSWVRSHATRWLYRDVLRKPDPDDYFLGQFAELERGSDGVVAQGRDPLASQVQAIQAISKANGARLLVVLIPSGPQVCSSGDLAYWPHGTDLTNAKFDTDLPQRVSKQITSHLQVETFDLLPMLRSAGTCVFQPRNMHWTAAGHHLVAESVAQYLQTHSGI